MSTDTYWNERVGRVEPTREGQPLRWWYGPAKADPNPRQKWCHDCYGVVDEGDGRRWCRLCKASQTLFDGAIEQQVDDVTRQLAATWVRYPSGISSVAGLRALIVQVLSGVLAGRTVVQLPEPDGRTYGGSSRWDASARRIIAKVDKQGRPYVRVDERIWLDGEAESVGLALVAAAREARRLAAGPGSGGN